MDEDEVTGEESEVFDYLSATVFYETTGKGHNMIILSIQSESISFKFVNGLEHFFKNY